mgnify:CR=1 FL=1
MIFFLAISEGKDCFVAPLALLEIKELKYFPNSLTHRKIKNTLTNVNNQDWGGHLSFKILRDLIGCAHCYR